MDRVCPLYGLDASARSNAIALEQKLKMRQKINPINVIAFNFFIVKPPPK